MSKPRVELFIAGVPVIYPGEAGEGRMFRAAYLPEQLAVVVWQVGVPSPCASFAANADGARTFFHNLEGVELQQ